jgi:16S rRNA processing protein RimM
MTPPRFADLIAIGRVVRPQGRKGELLTESLSDRPDRFPSLRKVYVPAPLGGAREVYVAGCWPHKGRFVLKLSGVDSIDAAEAYRGLELRIGTDELAALPEGSYYHHELKGLTVEDLEGRPLGTVLDVVETGAGAPVLVINDGPAERLLPLADEFVKRVDVSGGRLTVSLPEETFAAQD